MQPYIITISTLMLVSYSESVHCLNTILDNLPDKSRINEIHSNLVNNDSTELQIE